MAQNKQSTYRTAHMSQRQPCSFNPIIPSCDGEMSCNMRAKFHRYPNRLDENTVIVTLSHDKSPLQSALNSSALNDRPKIQFERSLNATGHTSWLMF